MSKVDVVLLNDVKGCGKNGEIVSISEGYARNFLLPKKLAKIADNAAIMELEAQKEAEARRQEEELKQAESVKSLINGQSVDIHAKCGENGKLFGSVTSKDVADVLNEKFNLSLDKRKIKLAVEGLKAVDAFGTYQYEVKIHTGVNANIKVNVKEEVEQ